MTAVEAAPLWLLLAVFPASWRLLRGPTAHDRLVALNMFVATVAASMALFAVTSGRMVYLDVALVYALLGYVSVIAIARYLRGGG